MLHSTSKLKYRRRKETKNEKRGKYNYLRCGHRLVEPDAVRLRAFVKPPSDFKWTKPDGMVVKLGYADTAGLIHSAKRARALDMKILLDFHYSDHFADTSINASVSSVRV